ncbi:viral A-type inclusion protein [Histomonas meleagridis]|uniref:viral A-type inclusion protein n=1 Tax=Histomonas meleagridis TaxID=135588 RepID=UPI003559AD9C|nr:viral A-type inclusion protein [Histomonas meleagridis]KAH0798201.1 viral A-type inclusion protein [Histomonas meleagridis]
MNLEKEITTSNETKISELQNEIKELNAIINESQNSHEKELANKENAIKELKLQINEKMNLEKELTTSNETKISELQNEIASKDDEIRTLSAKLHELESELTSRKSQIGELSAKLQSKENEIAELQSANAQILALQSALQTKENEISACKSQISTLSTSCAELRQQYETLQRESTSEEISKLKTLLERASKSDAIKQKRINELEQQLNDTENVTSIKERNISNSNENVNELQMKNKKLEKMLKKSNQLYAELLEKSILLQQELNNSNIENKNKEKHYKIQTQQMFYIDNKIKKNENDENELKKENGVNHRNRDAENDSTMRMYLRRSMLQFFLQDDAKKEAMIPMILELVGCTQQQIATAQRQWARSHQLFAKTSFFGFGK